MAGSIEEAVKNLNEYNNSTLRVSIMGTRQIRQFETGATRDTDNNKNDYEGFLSPLVIEAFGNYMTKHRIQTDGNLRASDNWAKGIPRNQYMKSLWRHVMQLWKLHRGYHPVLDEKGNVVTFHDALSGVMFNVMGYFHEFLLGRDVGKNTATQITS